MFNDQCIDLHTGTISAVHHTPCALILHVQQLFMTEALMPLSMHGAALPHDLMPLDLVHCPHQYICKL